MLCCNDRTCIDVRTPLINGGNSARRSVDFCVVADCGLNFFLCCLPIDNLELVSGSVAERGCMTPIDRGSIEITCFTILTLDKLCPSEIAPFTRMQVSTEACVAYILYL